MSETPKIGYPWLVGHSRLAGAKPPSGPGWTHEIKHDGFRILARKEGQRVTPFRGASGRWWASRWEAGLRSQIRNARRPLTATIIAKGGAVQSVPGGYSAIEQTTGCLARQCAGAADNICRPVSVTVAVAYIMVRPAMRRIMACAVRIVLRPSPRRRSGDQERQSRRADKGGDAKCVQSHDVISDLRSRRLRARNRSPATVLKTLSLREMFQQKAATRRRLLAADGALIFAKACSHRLDDVLQFLIAKIADRQRLDLPVHLPGKADRAGFGDAFQFARHRGARERPGL